MEKKWKEKGNISLYQKKTNTDKKYLAVKIDGKEYIAKNLIAAVFIRSYKKMTLSFATMEILEILG